MAKLVALTSLQDEIDKTVSASIAGHVKNVDDLLRTELTRLIVQMIDCGDLTAAIHRWNPDLEPILTGHTLTIRTSAGLIYKPYADLEKMQSIAREAVERLSGHVQDGLPQNTDCHCGECETRRFLAREDVKELAGK